MKIEKMMVAIVSVLIFIGYVHASPMGEGDAGMKGAPAQEGAVDPTEEIEEVDSDVTETADTEAEEVVEEQVPPTAETVLVEDDDFVNYEGVRYKKTGVTAGLRVRGTSGGSSPMRSFINLIETVKGTYINGSFRHIPGVGNHGIHVHENSSCASKGIGAGGHYNPKSTKHGFLPKDGLEGSHAGDMGNLNIGTSGQGSINVFLPNVFLSGDDANIAGRTIILHEKEDDFGQPTGNAGARIGCGIIKLN